MIRDIFLEVCRYLLPKDTKAIYLTDKQYYGYFSENQREAIIEAAKGLAWCTRYASIEGYKVALKGVPIGDYIPSIMVAAAKSRIDIITYLYTTYPLIVNQLLGWVLLFAAKYGNDETIEYILPKIEKNRRYYCQDSRLNKIYDCLSGEFVLSKFFKLQYEDTSRYDLCALKRIKQAKRKLGL